MTDAQARISQKRRISPIWFVPIVAALLGIWMVVYTIQSQGPEIEIRFSTAEGIEAGKTKIKLRDVEIGLVESAGLGEDLQSVIVTARLEKEAERLLREDTDFWVVRPRIGKGGVSGLGTMLSGAYIQVDPGSSEKKTRKFVGLEEPPVTPAGTPGIHVELESDRAGSVSAGDPILYKGFDVGWVESADFDIASQTMRYEAFIEAPYDDLVTTNTRFWNVSGISFTAGADGIRASAGSLDTLLMGGLEFGLPRDVAPGNAIESGADFQLYASYEAVNERPYRHTVDYVVRFPQSVRGLQPGAPVEYRGLQAGRVERVMLEEMADARSSLTDQRRPAGAGVPIPVLIRLEPARLHYPDGPEGVDQLRATIEESVRIGMRASLETGNLLTGGLYVAFDVLENPADEGLGTFMGYTTIPTIESGLGGLEQRVTMLLDKVNDLPLDATVAELQGSLAGLNEMLSSDSTQTLPTSLDQTLRDLQRTLASFSDESELQARLLPTITELDRTLASLRQVLDTLSDQPNALIFNRAQRDDPEPPAGSE